MTVLEEIRGIEDRVASRLRELAPLVAEFEELRAVADRLGMDVDVDTSGTSNRSAAAPAKPRRTTRTATRPSARPRGSSEGGTKAVGARRREDVLRVVRQRPGITVAQVGTELNVDRTALYRVVRRLEADGLLVKQGTGLRPTGG